MTIEEKMARTVEDLLLHLKVDGWCMIEGVVPEDEVDDVRERVVRTVASPGYQADKNFIACNTEFAHYVADTRILAILEALWGRFARVAFTGPIRREPGDGRGAWHSDWPFGQSPAASIAAPYPFYRDVPHDYLDPVTVHARNRHHHYTGKSPVGHRPARRRPCRRARASSNRDEGVGRSGQCVHVRQPHVAR